MMTAPKTVLKRWGSNMKRIIEAFEVGDLDEILMPEIGIDIYASKIGSDQNIIVLSFLINDRQAAIDVVDFFEKGYDFILDADISSSEITPGSYLVFVELLRRTRNIEQIFMLVDDLSAASGLNRKEWKFQYLNIREYYPLTRQNLKAMVPLTPHAYNLHVKEPVTEIKKLAGLPIHEHYQSNSYTETLKHAAGIDSSTRRK